MEVLYIIKWTKRNRINDVLATFMLHYIHTKKQGIDNDYREDTTIDIEYSN